MNKNEIILLKEYITDDWKWLVLDGTLIDGGHTLNIREAIPYILEQLGYDVEWEQIEGAFIVKKENDGN